jgi:predicted nucleotidyltransferase
MFSNNISSAIGEVAQEIGADKAILFGSFARGTQDSKSDIDVIFIKNTNDRFLDRLDIPLGLLYKKIKGRGIDVLVYSPAEFQKMINDGNKFIAGIVREGRVIYES